jgi:fermentation-respiration switch protein FrsA (DUF1100 family)
MSVAFFKILTWAIIGYVSLMGFMYVFQRHFTFQPSSSNPFQQDHRPFQSFTYKTPMGMNLRGLRLFAQTGKPTIVYFHGNAGHLGDRMFKADSFAPHGYGFVLVGYRGYSGNPGQASEQGFYEDGRTVINMLLAEGIKIEDIIIYGESIGSGTATQMATEYPKARALILEAPFTSAAEVAERIYFFLPVRKLMRDKFENDKKIASITMPLLVIHGTKDLTVVYRLGQKLFAKSKSRIKEFVTVEGAGHGDLYNFGAGDKIYAFLAKL